MRRARNALPTSCVMRIDDALVVERFVLARYEKLPLTVVDVSVRLEDQRSVHQR